MFKTSVVAFMIVVLIGAALSTGNAGIKVTIEDYGVDLDKPDPNSLAAPDDVIKDYAVALFRTEGIGHINYGESEPWPAVTDYSGAVQVTSGKPYILDTFWCNKAMPFLTVPTPKWARMATISIGGVQVRPDGKFVAHSDGFVVRQWWDTNRPWIRWAVSIEVLVKKPAK